MSLTRTERRLRAQLASHQSWATTPDRSARTAAGRSAFNKKFLDQVPAEITDPAARAKAAESLRKAYYARMALKSAKARRKAKAAKETRHIVGGDAA